MKNDEEKPAATEAETEALARLRDVLGRDPNPEAEARAILRDMNDPSGPVARVTIDGVELTRDQTIALRVAVAGAMLGFLAEGGDESEPLATSVMFRHFRALRTMLYPDAPKGDGRA